MRSDTTTIYGAPRTSNAEPDPSTITGAHLPRLTVRELRAIGGAHMLLTTFDTGAGEHARGYRGACDCGLTFFGFDGLTSICEAHDRHAAELILNARRARHLAGLSRHRGDDTRRGL